MLHGCRCGDGSSDPRGEEYEHKYGHHCAEQHAAYDSVVQLILCRERPAGRVDESELVHFVFGVRAAASDFEIENVGYCVDEGGQTDDELRSESTRVSYVCLIPERMADGQVAKRCCHNCRPRRTDHAHFAEKKCVLGCERHRFRDGRHVP